MEVNKVPSRCVQAFTIAALQKNTKVIPPCKINIYQQRNVHKSMFRRLFLRGDLPCHQKTQKDRDPDKKLNLAWKIRPEDLDYSYYLPIFFDGLCEADFPYNFLARYAIHDMLASAGEKVRSVVPQLVIPIKSALNTRNSAIIVATLRIIQHMCICDPCIAKILVPYFRQILPILNLYRNRSTNMLDAIDYDRAGRLSDIIEKTLTILERQGGPDAYINIKWNIPTYESCVNN